MQLNNPYSNLNQSVRVTWMGQKYFHYMAIHKLRRGGRYKCYTSHKMLEIWLFWRLFWPIHKIITRLSQNFVEIFNLPHSNSFLNPPDQNHSCMIKAWSWLNVFHQQWNILEIFSFKTFVKSSLLNQEHFLFNRLYIFVNITMFHSKSKTFRTMFGERL